MDRIDESLKWTPSGFDAIATIANGDADRVIQAMRRAAIDGKCNLMDVFKHLLVLGAKGPARQATYLTPFCTVILPDDFPEAATTSLHREYLVSIEEAVEQMYVAGTLLSTRIKSMKFSDWKTQYARQRRTR